MSLAAQIIDQRLAGIATEQSDALTSELRLGGDKNRERAVAFAYLVAQCLFDLTDEETIDGLVGDGGDLGVDAVYFELEGPDELLVRLIQTQYEAENLSGRAAFPEFGIANLITAVGAILDPEARGFEHPRLESRVEEIRSCVRGGAIPRVIAVAANNGASWTESAQQRIRRAGKDLGERVEWHHIGANEILAILLAREPIDVDLRLKGKATVEEFQFRRVLTGRMSVSELVRLTSEYGDRLFEGNIRNYLGLPAGRVNDAVVEILRDPDQRPNFYLCNNGITLTSNKFRFNALQEDNWAVKASDLRIVSGGETALAIRQMASEVGDEISTADVLVRLYELDEDDDALVDEITLATNSQSPVDLRDLRSNDQRQRELRSSIAELGYTYRTKREDRPPSSNEFTSATVAEAVLAVWRERPHQARFRRRGHFGVLYDTIFTADLNGAQAVVAALLHRYAEDARRRPADDAPDFLPYGSRFIAMLMGRYLLEEMAIQLDGLNHLSFAAASERVDQQTEKYFARAVDQISNVLEPMFSERRPRTLQRLSATFRRPDLVEDLVGPQLPLELD